MFENYVSNNQNNSNYYNTENGVLVCTPGSKSDWRVFVYVVDFISVFMFDDVFISVFVFDDGFIFVLVFDDHFISVFVFDDVFISVLPTVLV